MKTNLCLFFFLFILVSKAQEANEKKIFLNFSKCESEKCKISNSFLLAEYYLEIDDIYSSQKWLEKTKDLVSPKKTDTTTVFIHSLQSELFYYDGLFQFGTNEAGKAILKAIELKDSLLIANGYFFKGINQMEMNKLEDAEKSLWKAKAYQPKKGKTYIRSAIQNEHIFNNVAQLKLKTHQIDSAVWYNAVAYQYAKKAKSKRGIPNIEQTFGQIYLQEKKLDSAIYYFQKSIQSAQKNEYYDVVLLNYGFLMQCVESDQTKNNQYFEKGLELINQKTINTTFQHYFYTITKNVFKKTNQVDKLNLAQEKLIEINEKTRFKDNFYIQNH